MFGTASPTSCKHARPARSWALAAAVAIAVTSGCGTGEDPVTAGPDGSIVTSTTRIADAGVLGNERRPDESCAADPAPLDDGPPEREVRNAAVHGVSPPLPETTRVAADPQRIVALSGDQLDALCALGLQSRIVAAALPDGSDEQPSYLGTVVHQVAPAGHRDQPDLDAIRAANPDLILGAGSLTARQFPDLSDIAPTVLGGPPGAAWKDNLRTVGAAVGRQGAANRLIEDFERDAARTGTDNDGTHFQASVVQFTDTTLRVFGIDNFPGTVLADVGVDRPVTQRFRDKPFIEVNLDDGSDLSIADGDIIYVSFATAEAKDRATEVMRGDAWKRLSANRDDRVFAVNNEVWQTGAGIVAARGMLADLRWINAPIN
ncbi:iron-siderophore ABC transporter substrate-binding protein [Mycobacterium sp. SMC-4]|uniref:iron-siderophore ABC transporter substrate-binding protein n=1 Tax=Mycobacterium sp. SMC-4 TaxID=2857059 RepID=UPI003D092BFE